MATTYGTGSVHPLPDKQYDALHALSYGGRVGGWGDGYVWARVGDALAEAGLVELWSHDVAQGRRKIAAKLTDAGWSAFEAERRARRNANDSATAADSRA